MKPKTRLRKVDIAHLLRSAAAITQCSQFVLVGTGAVIARAKNLPLDLLRTREIDIYPLDVEESDTISTLIDGTIGEGSQFDLTYGYYAHGVGPETASLPRDWRDRSQLVRLAPPSSIECLCPDASDIGLSKLCAWREKDREWIQAAILNGVISLEVMAARAPLLEGAQVPPEPEIRRRLQTLKTASGRSS